MVTPTGYNSTTGSISSIPFKSIRSIIVLLIQSVGVYVILKEIYTTTTISLFHRGGSGPTLRRGEQIGSLLSSSSSSSSSSMLPEVFVSSLASTRNGTNKIFNFEPHRGALLAAIQPGRGYKPTRHETWLPDVNGSYWWIDHKVPESFSIAALDQVYPLAYFLGGHPTHIVDIYTQYVFHYGSMIVSNHKVSSIVEFGNGGGYFSKQFSNLLESDSFTTVEGSTAGIFETLEHWKVPLHQVIHHDLRHPLYLGRRYDIAVCTEVVEHVEPPFTSQIIITLIAHSDVIWFSYREDSYDGRSWINHPNERPLKMWKNLFDFYGYDIVMIPDEIKSQIAWRGSFIAYRRDNPTLTVVTTRQLKQKKIIVPST